MFKSLKGWLPEPAFIMSKAPAKNTESSTTTTHRCSYLFVGTPVTLSSEAGQLLEKMIKAMQVKPDDYFISSFSHDLELFKKEVFKLNPKVIISLGETVMANSLSRGQKFEFEGRPVIFTFHPSYLLKNATAKKEAWEDLQKAMSLV